MADLEKVIKGLESHRERTVCVNEEGEVCPYFSYEDCHRRLTDDALELLKEQEAIKPTVIVDTWVCSKCGHELERQELIDDKENPQILVHDQYNFCPNCGKAVKWE